MSAAPPDSVRLMSGLISHMQQIVGDGACYAMLHYGAMEEGKRFGAGSGPADLQKVLDRLDAILAHETEVVEDDGDKVVVRIHASDFLATGQRVSHGVVLGLLEGALTVTRNARYKGSVVQTGQDGDVVLELTRER